MRHSERVTETGRWGERQRKSETQRQKGTMAKMCTDAETERDDNGDKDKGQRGRSAVDWEREIERERTATEQ